MLNIQKREKGVSRSTRQREARRRQLRDSLTPFSRNTSINQSLDSRCTSARFLDEPATAPCIPSRTPAGIPTTKPPETKRKINSARVSRISGASCITGIKIKRDTQDGTIFSHGLYLIHRLGSRLSATRVDIVIPLFSSVPKLARAARSARGCAPLRARARPGRF